MTASANRSDGPPILPPTRQRPAPKAFLTVAEWRQLLVAARASSRRDEALLLLTYECGLRREEPGLLRLSYIARLHERIVYLWRGKGSQTGDYELSATTAKALHAWVNEAYPDREARRPESFVFPGYRRKGLTGRAVYAIYTQLAIAAGLPSNAHSPHALKRSRCQHILEAAERDGSIPVDRLVKSLAKIVGHRSAMTTVIHYTQQTKRERELVQRVTDDLVE